MIVEVPSGLNATVQIPCDCVGESRLDGDLADRTDPGLALLGTSAITLLNLILVSALQFGFWE